QTIGYVYDALDRLTRKNLPDSAGVDYIYDLVGKIQQVNDPSGTYTFAYDNMGRLLGTSTQYTFLPGNTYANIYTYDQASNRTSFTRSAERDHQLHVRHAEPAEHLREYASRAVYF